MLAAWTAFIACSKEPVTVSASTMTVTLSTDRAATLAEGDPELPRVYLDTNYTPPTGRTIAVNAGGDFQAALNQAQPGDVITLQAGATFTGNFTLPNKTGTGWITIRSSVPDANLPKPGTRITPAYSSLMPKLITPDSAPVIETAKGAHHYRFIGIEFGLAPGKFAYTLVSFDGQPKSGSELAHDLIIDRCYIHGNPNDQLRRGVTLNCGAAAVIDSYVSDCHTTQTDSQAIACWNGAGPFKIVNNYLEGAGENVIFGGADPNIQGLVPSDIEFRRNHCNKPLSWKANDPSYAGTRWSIKNQFELKNAQRVLVDQNLFENNWADSQDGMAILFTPRNQNGSAPWSVVQDVTFTNNIVRHSGGGFNISGQDDVYPSQITRRILIKNNLLDDINGSKWTATTESADGEFIQIGSGAQYVTVDHNTCFQSGTIISAGEETIPNFVFRNNIVPHNSYGVIATGKAPGMPTLDAYFPGVVFLKNVLVSVREATYPGDNFQPDSFDAVRFVDFGAGNYRLAASSPYKGAGTDRLDIGCNIDALFGVSSSTSVNAASYRDTPLAPEAITAVFGAELASVTASASSAPLPTSLGGTSVRVRDSTGAERPASLFFVSPNQVNFLIPPETVVGTASIIITNSRSANAIGLSRIERVAPGIFTADASGRGVPTGLLLRHRNNSQTYEPIARFDQAQNRWAPIPIDLNSPSDQVYLVLFGTGMRNRIALGSVTAVIGGASVQVVYADKQGVFAGLDQVNILLPNSLAGRGDVDLVLTVDGQAANTVRVNIK
jgi:uncharacterized protein (TIGR03437 family)